MATPLMNLSLPVVSTTAGPAWATALNAALTVVDGHDHSSGKGTKVTPAGFNVNADLTLAGYNATNVRSARMVNHSAVLALATDASCLSVVGGNLYYNNAAGTPIQITAGAALNAASIGAIGGDYSTSTASVFYTAASQFFSFWQAANKSANLDVGKVIIREPGVVSPFGITLQSPAGLAAAYSLTLPASLPASTKVLGLGSTGILQSLDSITLGDAAAISLPRAGAQTILKGGTGKLQVGTSVNEDVEFIRNNVVALALTATGIDAKTQKILNVVDPVGAQDADTLAARDAAITAHNAVTNPHSATSAATALRLVLRDSDGGFEAGSIIGTGSGTGLGVSGYGATSGPGVKGTGGSVGVGVQAIAGGGASPARGALGLNPQAAPSAPVNGDMWVETTSNVVKVKVNGTVYTLTMAP